MDSSRWRRLDQLLEQALQLPPEQRAAWIQQQAQDLQDDLRSLVAEADNLTPSDWFESGPSLDDSPEPMEPTAAQTIIGPYRLIREIGRGGIGTVWLANREDRQPDREVALKLPRFWSTDAQQIALLKRESDILATLNHPGIARLYEAGVTPQGRPWFAMEYVEGTPLDQYAQSLDIRARLNLFLQIAKAVAFAHARLVLHRDLKPSNVLVDNRGKAHLLDFGAGKMFDSEADSDSTVTRLWGTRAMTPDYASPEQLLAEPLSVATDIYSLGVVLYELLGGSRPYRMGRTPPSSLESVINNRTIQAPSTTADNAAISSQLQGDLDTIVLKAMRRDPGQRYPAVQALIDDIDRYLNGYPVTARPLSRVYVARKFLARNRLATIGVLLLITSIGVGAALTTQQARLVEQQRQQTEAVQGYLADLIRSSNPVANGPADPTVAELLERSLSDLDQRPGLDQETHYRIKALLVDGLARIRGVDSIQALAAGLAEQAELELGKDHPTAVSARAVALGGLRLPGALLDSREELIAVVERARATEGLDQEYLLLGLQGLYRMHTQAWEFSEAAQAAREATELAEQLLGPSHPRAINMRILLANGLLRTRENGPALDTAQAAYQQVQQIGRDTKLDPLSVESRLTLGDALAANGEHLRAVNMLAGAVEESLQLYPDQNSRAMTNLGTLARIQDRTGDLESAIITYRRVLSRFTGTDKAAEAAIRSNLVRSLVAARHHDEAIMEGAAWLTLTEGAPKTAFPYHTTADAARIAMALSYCWAGDVSEARRMLEGISEDYRVLRPGSMLDPGHAEGILADLSGDHAQAIAIHQAALDAILAASRSSHNEMHVRTALGLALKNQGSLQQAAAQLDAALALYSDFHHWPTPRWDDAKQARDEIRLRLGSL
ncbi:MAG: hypothetical protein DHS20C11_32770 [Lysobacteraceae bacterium]|nr:MAG: hypothetical protein DHS20C11_32770 [Xanthomonadaceae bacterium]